MRDCVFLLADKNMKAVFEGFLSRPNVCRSLGCAPFQFDFVVASGLNDPGIYVRGHELIRNYQRTHRHAIVVLDVSWGGSPGKEKIEEHIRKNLLLNGWTEDTAEVVAINPELESWVWIDSAHVAQVLGWDAFSSLKSWLSKQKIWPKDAPKPSDPKQAVEACLERIRKRRSSSLYADIATHLNPAGCTDSAFAQVKGILQLWFPLKAGK